MTKILFCDMDGTIIHLNKIIHDLDKEKMHELRSNGHLVAFDTGRNQEEAMNVINKLGFPYDYLVLNNGAHIVGKAGNEILKKVIPEKVGKAIIECAMAYQEVWVFFYNGIKTLGYYKGKTYIHGDDGDIEIFDYDFIKEYQGATSFDIIALHQDNQETDKLLEIKQFINDNYAKEADSFINVHYLDVTASGCSKGTGVDVINKLHHNTLETYSVGDSFNDLSMFEKTDHSYTFNHVSEDIYKHVDKQVDYVFEVIADMLK